MGSTEPLVAAAVASVEGSADEVSVLEPVLDIEPEPVDDEEEPVVPEEAVFPPAVEEEVVLWPLAPSLELELEPEPWLGVLLLLLPPEPEPTKVTPLHASSLPSC